MATSSEEAALLKQSLTENELQQKNHQLQTTLQELSERNLNLQNELEVVRLEKEKLQTNTLTIENEKKETEQKLVQLTDSERLLREYIKTTVDTLNSKRDALQKTQAELNELRQKEITNRIEIERATFQIRQLQTSTQSIEHQLLTANARVESLNNQIRLLENERDNLREDMRLERSRLEEKLEDLKTEKESSADQIEQLRSQLDHARDRVLQAEDKLADMKAARDQVELSLGSTSQAFKKLQKIHEEYSVDSHKRMTAYEAKIALIVKEKEELESAKKELEQQLSDERELRKAQFNQITGLHSPNDDDDSKPPSDLLKLIHEYQQIGKRPEDIFQDYFELRSKYMQSIQKNTHESDCVESLSRKLNEKAKLFERVHRELKSAKAANAELEQKIQQEKTQKQQAEASSKQVSHQIDDLTKENNNLKASLNDTTYQLQFILSDIERRNQPIPATLKSTAALLNGAEITPNLPHNQLVYTNVAELQDCNKQLMIENKTLKDKVQQLSDEAGTSDIIRRSDTSFYKAAVAEAKQAMTELEAKNQELQAKVDRKTAECDNYQKMINQFGDSDDVAAKFAQIQEAQVRQREEMDITFDQYRKETLDEVNKLKEELEAARNSDREARLSLSEVSSQRRYLEQRIERLNTSTEELNQELKTAHRQSSTLHERIAARDKEIVEIKSELQDYKARVEHLRHENALLTTRMEVTDNAYKEVKEAVSKESTEKAQLTSLLEVIKSRMDDVIASGREKTEQSVETVERLTRELRHARESLTLAEKQLESYKAVDQSEIQDKYREATVEIRLLKTKITELEQQLSNVNQERIIAQTKLSSAEEQLKAANSSVNTDDESSDVNAHLLAEAQDRVRVLEANIEEFHTIIQESETKTKELQDKHDKYIVECQTTIDKLIKNLEERTTEVTNIQNEAQMAIAEYKSLSEQSKAAQEELSTQKQSLEEKVGALELSSAEQHEKIKSLEATLEEKTLAHSEIETKLANETQIAEEQRQTINSLRADVSNLTFEISQYKTTIAAAANTESSLRAELEREVSERNLSDQEWKKKLDEAEKRREQLSESVSELVAKHAEWSVAHDKETGSERAEFDRTAKEIIQQLREACATLNIEKDASENNYRHERLKVKRAESEAESARSQVALLQADLTRLRKENKELSEKELKASSTTQLERDAFKAQNHQLLYENNVLRELREAAQLEKSKLADEVAPLKLKISILESQLETTTQSLEVLTKGQKDWAARSAKLLEKYNKSDPAETENLKSELEATKTELEKTKTELESVKSEVEKLQGEKKKLESTVETLEETVKTKESERANITVRANERGRIAMDLKRRLEASEKSLNEVKEKLSQAEKKVTEAEKKATEAEKKVTETIATSGAGSTTANAESEANPAQKAELDKLTKEKETLEEQKKAAEEAKATLETELAAAKAETANFEKKYSGLLQKARHVQIEKNRISKELEALKASAATNASSTTATNSETNNNTNNSAETAALKAKIAELEKELANARKALSESTVEINRYKAQTSMAQNKSNRLQKELDALKASAASTAPVEKKNVKIASPVISEDASSQVTVPVPAVAAPTLSESAPTTPKVSVIPASEEKDSAPVVEETAAAPTPVVATDLADTEELPTTPAAIVSTPEPSSKDNTTIEAELTMEMDADVAAEENGSETPVVETPSNNANTVETSAPVDELVEEKNEVPVEVEESNEAAKENTEQKPSAITTELEPSTVDSPIIFAEETAESANLDTNSNGEEPSEAKPSGTKRERVDTEEEGEINEPGSPNKKANTSS